MVSNGLQRVKILIVDDEPLIQKLVRGVLTYLGFTDIKSTNNGRKAQELIQQTPFDIVITDWRMSDLDGIDIIRFVRGAKTSPFYKTPIIMLTGNTEDYYVKTAINAGVNAYLIKPFSAEQLIKRIRSVIEAPRDFVVSRSFTGPDRRHADQPPPDGIERRKRRKG
jgi:DNA-binding response OmpR family regulator